MTNRQCEYILHIKSKTGEAAIDNLSKIKKISKKFYLLFIICIFFSTSSFSQEDGSLTGVTPGIKEYVVNTVKPILDVYPEKDKLSLLLKISDILNGPETGINKNVIKPSNFIIYDKLDKLKLGFLITFKLSSEQKKILKSWHSKYMHENPADVFFAPSADEIIKTKAAFGCSHYARSFVAVVKVLGLIENPGDMRYIISCKADDYNKALKEKDNEMTINGHQFVMVKISGKWIAINTSKGEWTAMPDGFSPDDINPPENIPVRFASYPDITFLLRKAGKSFDDDCGDNSLTSLMNIYRSGDPGIPDFKWKEFSDRE